MTDDDIEETVSDIRTQLRKSDRFAEGSAVLVILGGLGLLGTGAVEPTPETLGSLVSAAGVLGLGSERLWWLLGLAGVETPDDKRSR